MRRSSLSRNSRLDRRPGNAGPRSRVIGVAYDGAKTEAEYVRGWARMLGPKGVVLTPYYVRSGGNSRDAVDSAKKAFARDPDLDERWCICDVDDTRAGDVRQAVTDAAAADIQLCLSTRSFEIWLALHWSKISTAPILTEREAVDLVRAHWPAYSRSDKSVPFRELFDRADAACTNADWLRRQGHANPATDVDKLVKQLLVFSTS